MSTLKEIYLEITEACTNQYGVEYDFLDSLDTLSLITDLEDEYSMSIPMWDHKPPMEELAEYIYGNTRDE